MVFWFFLIGFASSEKRVRFHIGPQTYTTKPGNLAILAGKSGKSGCFGWKMGNLAGKEVNLARNG